MAMCSGPGGSLQGSTGAEVASDAGTGRKGPRSEEGLGSKPSSAPGCPGDFILLSSDFSGAKWDESHYLSRLCEFRPQLNNSFLGECLIRARLCCRHRRFPTK